MKFDNMNNTNPTKTRTKTRWTQEKKGKEFLLHIYTRRVTLVTQPVDKSWIRTEIERRLYPVWRISSMKWVVWKPLVVRYCTAWCHWLEAIVRTCFSLKLFVWFIELAASIEMTKSETSERSYIYVLGVISQRSYIYVLGVISQRSYIYVLVISILSLSTIFLLDFGIVRTV